MNKLFSLDGRLSRSNYVMISATVTILMYAAAFIAGIAMGLAGAGESASDFAGGIIGLVATVIIAFATVKRFHDMDRPGWHYWLLLVPFYNIYLSIVLLFSRGTEGRNKYGDVPGANPATMRPETGRLG